MKNNNSFLNKYQKIELIGKGTYAKVYKVKNKIDNKIYALKQIDLYGYKKNEINKSLNEIKLLSTLKHDNIIKFHNSYYDKKKNILYILLEYLEGGDMFDMIKKMKHRNIYLPEGKIIDYIYQIIIGISFIHSKNIIHRDLKLANILLNKDKSKIKIGDFNVSKEISNIYASTQTGTPYYSSPEIWKKLNHSFETDIWSLGCLIYELCNYKPPFYGENLEILKNNILNSNITNWNTIYSQNLFNFVNKCLIKDKQLRPKIYDLLSNKIFDKIKNNINKSIKRKNKKSYDFNIKTTTNFTKKKSIELNKIHKSQINSNKNILTNKRNFTPFINQKKSIKYFKRPRTQINKKNIIKNKINIINDFKITPLKKYKKINNKKKIFENINNKIGLKISKSKLLNYGKINKPYIKKNYLKNKIFLNKKIIRPYSNINKKRNFKIVKRIITPDIYFNRQKKLENKLNF